ncbi:hypothetical protein EYS85_11280 [Salmonella enterica]|nr:hypothetical protein [Salmonella enterica]EBU7448964.1 hypothetical protein [Salmonella enterica subsp. enterica serovar Mbandaka]EAM6480611.1 hypothetical protein [Salmonella enterica]EAN4482617.1 hypothetical protein [Salmonella enterica]EAT1203494.1 hypothetical protein [Salmonella enterica]
MTDFGGKTSIFSHPVYLFLRKFSLQDSRGGSVRFGEERQGNSPTTPCLLLYSGPTKAGCILPWLLICSHAKLSAGPYNPG